MTGKTLGWGLIAVAAALEYSHYQVTSGTVGTGTLAQIEGTLANFDELTGANLHLGYILGIVGVYLLIR